MEGDKKKILIIEGDKTFADKLKNALDGSGYAASVFNNGTDGLKAIVDILPHLIILDVVLSGIDGYAILGKIQEEPLLKKIPLFLLSTQGVPINIGRVPQGSVQEYILSMHADPKDILDKVDKHFGRQLSGGKTEKMEASNGASGGKKILWVEDDKLIGNILTKKLVSSGFDLHHAKNAEEAMAILATVKPDIIIVDLLLQGLSGFDILKRLQNEPSLKAVPKMVLSNLSKPSDVERAKVLGANRFLVKATVSLDQIVSNIRELCK